MNMNSEDRDGMSVSPEGTNEALARERDALRRQDRELRAANATMQARVQTLEKEAVRLEATLAARTQQVHSLNQTLRAAEDTMHLWTHKILHNDVQQALYGMRLQLLSLAGTLSQSLPQSAKLPVEESLNHLLGTTESLVATVKDLAVMLSPPVNPDTMLPELLGVLAQRVGALYEIDVTLDVAASFRPGTDELPHGVGALLFRTLRTLLLSLVMATGIRRAEMLLEMEGEGIVVTLRNPGEGFDLAHMRAESPVQLGLHPIQERLQSAGGRLEIREGQDGAIALYVPLGGVAPGGHA